MTTLIVQTRDGQEKRLDGEDGLSVMENIRRTGIDEMLALCGGVCSCATCHVYVDEAHLVAMLPASDDENDLLDYSDHRQATSRLSCQISLAPALEGLRVTIAPES